LEVKILELEVKILELEVKILELEVKNTGVGSKKYWSWK